MVFGFIYSCLRLLLDLVDVRRRMQDSEAELLLLRHQLRVLRRQIKRARLEPVDRLIMAGLSRLVSREALSGLLVEPETVLRWHRELVRRKWAAFGSHRGSSRPPLSDEVCALILRMAKDNRTWGRVHIQGELILVGHRVSIPAIRNLLRKRRVPGSPIRSGLSWKAFLKAQARNVTWKLNELGIEAKFLIRDNDARFGGAFDLMMEGEGIAVIRTPIQTPLANSHIESRNRSTRCECLDRILIVSRGHLERVLSEWFAHYNEERLHRTLELKPPIARLDPVGQFGSVECRRRLGGLLNSYSLARPTVAA